MRTNLAPQRSWSDGSSNSTEYVVTLTKTEGKETFLWAVALCGFAGGTFCTGLVLSALHLNPLTITTPVSDAMTFVSTLLGAIVGGAISIGGTFWFQQRERALKRRSQALRLLLISSSMVTDMMNIRGDVVSSLDNNCWPVQPWTKVLPRPGAFALQSFDISELEVLIDAKEYKLVADLEILSRLSQSVSSSWNLYCQERRALAEIMPVHAMTGNETMSSLDNIENSAALLKIRELDTLIKSLLVITGKEISPSKETVEQLGDAFRRIFKDPVFPKTTYDKRSTGERHPTSIL